MVFLLVEVSGAENQGLGTEEMLERDFSSSLGASPWLPDPSLFPGNKGQENRKRPQGAAGGVWAGYPENSLVEKLEKPWNELPIPGIAQKSLGAWNSCGNVGIHDLNGLFPPEQFHDPTARDGN